MVRPAKLSTAKEQEGTTGVEAVVKPQVVEGTSEPVSPPAVVPAGKIDGNHEEVVKAKE